MPPLAAVSNDLVVSALTKPVGGAVHLRRGTVNMGLVKWLSIGAVPSAFGGVLIARALGSGARVENFVKYALGVALLVAVVSLLVKAYLRLRERARRRGDGASYDLSVHDLAIRPVATLLIGIVGGVVVGLTSVGSGSLIIIALIAIYPRLSTSSLVGTDLVCSVPLVASAALGHIIFGDFHASVALPLVLGMLPGTYFGARMSATLPSGAIRRALTFVLLASSMKLLGVGTDETVIVLVAVIIVGIPTWMALRVHHGFRARPAAAPRTAPVPAGVPAGTAAQNTDED